MRRLSAARRLPGAARVSPRTSQGLCSVSSSMTWVAGAVAGAPGFEPGITGPKPVALPLGHAPTDCGLLQRRDVLYRLGRLPATIPETDRTTRGSGLAAPQWRRYKTAPPARSVAQPGSAPRSGRGGRRFKSCHSDQHFSITRQTPCNTRPNAVLAVGEAGNQRNSGPRCAPISVRVGPRQDVARCRAA